jgi:hypothetical protein
MADVTRLLDAAAAGDRQAAAELLPLVYDELQKLGAARLAGEKLRQTLQATALVGVSTAGTATGSISTPSRSSPRTLVKTSRRGMPR